MKVAFFLDNKDITSVDLRFPEKGNPGCGGTQYLFSCLPAYIAKAAASVEPLILAPNVDLLPESVQCIRCETLADAPVLCRRADAEFLVFHADPRPLLKLLRENNVKGIWWAHNIQDDKGILDEVAASNEIVRFVSVGHEAVDYIRDHRIYEKTSVIFNGFALNSVSAKAAYDHREKSVVYLGSLIRAKGFHRLARLWKRVLKDHPDAKLHVIGSGQLYNENSILGQYGIASPDYERDFIPFLLDDKGEVHQSVVFYGKLGLERFQIMQAASVGVPNPTGISEVCPGSAIEFQALGVPVVSAAEEGLLDTVVDGQTGFLCKEDDEMVSCIGRLLGDSGLQEKLGRAGVLHVAQSFSHQKNAAEWIALLEKMENSCELSKVPLKSNWGYKLKWLKEAVRRIKKLVPFLNRLPLIRDMPFLRWLRSIASSIKHRPSKRGIER